MKDYIAIDLETTGLDPQSSDITEIGAWKVKDGVVVDKFVTLVKPSIAIPQNIQELTGITMDMVADCEPIEPVIAEFFDWCGDLPFLAHNLPFDFGFLKAKGAFAGFDFTLGGTRKGIDTLALSRALLELDSNRLASVAQHFGVDVPDNNMHGTYHRASYDAYIAKLIYDRFLFGFPHTPSVVNPQEIAEQDTKYGKPSA